MPNDFPNNNVVDLDEEEKDITITNVGAEKNDMPFFHFKRYDILLRSIDMYATAVRSGNLNYLQWWYSNLYQLFINLTGLMKETENIERMNNIITLFNEAIPFFNEAQIQKNTTEGQYRKNVLLQNYIKKLNQINQELAESLQEMDLGIKIVKEAVGYE